MAVKSALERYKEEFINAFENTPPKGWWARLRWRLKRLLKKRGWIPPKPEELDLP